jgi:hypothetical protein
LKGKGLKLEREESDGRAGRMRNKTELTDLLSKTFINLFCIAGLE